MVERLFPSVARHSFNLSQFRINSGRQGRFHWDDLMFKTFIIMVGIACN